MMSDIVIIALIGAVPATMAAFFAGAAMFIGVRHSKEIQATRQTVAEAKHTVEVLETNTNSALQRLIEQTEKIAFQAGGDQARRDMQMGADAEKQRGGT